MPPFPWKREALHNSRELVIHLCTYPKQLDSRFYGMTANRTKAT